MRITPTQRTQLYETFKYHYKFRTGEDFRWKKGEKKRAISVFTLVCEALSVRDPDAFDDMLEVYKAYLETMSRKWDAWPDGDRFNYVGFMDKRERVATWCRKFLKALLGPQAVDKEVVGAGGKDSYEF